MTVSGSGESVRVYEARGRVGLTAAAFLAGGILVLLMLVLVFLLGLAMKQTPGPDMMPGMIGGLSVIGIGLLSRGIFLLKSLQRIVLNEHGVRLEGFISQYSLAWNQIERLEHGRHTSWFGGKSGDLLKLIGANGKTLAEIPSTLNDFADLTAQIEARSSAARGAATYDAAAEEQNRAKKSARMQKFAAVGAGVFALLFGALLVIGINEEIHLRRYASDGQRVEAKIVRRWMKRVTPYVEYGFRDSNGAEHSRETMITQEAYETFEDEPTVAVEFLRSDPGWNRLVYGEEAGPSFAGKFLFLSGGGFLLMTALATFAGLGYDLKTENGRTILVHHGRLLKTLGQTAGAAPVLEFEPGVQMPSPIQAMRPRKPVGIIVLGVLCILFGVCGAGMNSLRILLALQGSINLPDGRAFEFGQERWRLCWIAADGLLALGLMLSGIELLRLRRAGRSMALIIGGLQIASSIAGMIVLIVQMANAPQQNGPDSMQAVANQTAAVVGELIGIVFPIVLLAILARRKVAEVLRPGL